MFIFLDKAELEKAQSEFTEYSKLESEYG